jgi:hypothetical protein
MSKLRVMYVLYQYPQISETYIRSEIEAIRDECELRIFSLRRANAPFKNPEPFEQSDDAERMQREIREFRPHVLHTHWLPQVRELAYLSGYFGKAAEQSNVPFTVRAHSFDVLEDDQRHIRDTAPMLNSDLCYGVLSFPFTRPILRRNGVRDEKIFDCWPVINYARFHDESPNGPDVMNVGAALPKKQMENFLKLATMVPSRRFDLYALGYRSNEIDKLNAAAGHPVTIVPPVEPELMLKEYKRHQWLVYTASREMGTVAWPLAIAEAQAAGVGVCFPRLRPDLEEYVGPAGYLYDSIEDVVDIIVKPLPEERRRLGFEHARRSDVFTHRTTLLDLWRKAASAEAPAHQRSADGLLDWGEGDTPMEQDWRTRNLPLEIEPYVSEGSTFVEAGDASEWTGLRGDRRVLPFVERDGQYWGPPASDEVAIEELERMRQAGATALLFRDSNFWWFNHYREFARHVRARYQPLVENKRLIVFDLIASQDKGRGVGAP